MGGGENSPRYEIYWKFARIMRDANGEVLIAISSENYKRDFYNTRRQYVDNGFRVMNDTQVKDFFAKMIKNTVMRELRYCNHTSAWKRHNIDSYSDFLSYHVKVSIAEIYAIYEYLLGKPVTTKKYAESVIHSAFGKQRTEQEAQEAMKIKERRSQAEIEYQMARREFDAKEKAEVEAIRSKYANERAALYERYMKRLESIGNIPG